MTREEIAAAITAFIGTEFPSPEGDLTVHTVLLEEWFVDSMGVIETVLFLERAFGLEIARADINGDNFHSIATLTEFVANRLGLTGPSSTHSREASVDAGPAEGRSSD